VPTLVVKIKQTQQNFIFQKQKYVQVSAKVPVNGDSFEGEVKI